MNEFRAGLLSHLRRSITDPKPIHALTDVAIDCRPFGPNGHLNLILSVTRSYFKLLIFAGFANNESAIGVL